MVGRRASVVKVLDVIRVRIGLRWRVVWQARCWRCGVLGMRRGRGGRKLRYGRECWREDRRIDFFFSLYIIEIDRFI